MTDSILRDAVAELPLPDPALLREASSGDTTQARHDALAARVPALGLIEERQPERPRTERPERLRIAAWNFERCTRAEDSAALLRRAGASVALLTEMDLGMARSGNRHTARDVAGLLGAGHCFGVEFVELGLGAGRELTAFAGRENAGPLHGNAILSTLPFRDPFIVKLDGGGAWWALDWHHRRLGGRMAIGATVDLARGPVVLVAVHLEVHSTAEQRRAAMERVLAALPPGAPAVVAGDLNTGAMPRAGEDAEPDWFARADRREPLFGAMSEAGFAWDRCNTPDQTRRLIPDGRSEPWVQRVDWIFTRGLEASDPVTWAAVADDGATLSDHELITVEVR